MALDENISALIGRIYEGVDDSARWEAVLLDLKQLFGACCVLETVADLRHRELSRSTFYGSGTGLFYEGIQQYQEGRYQDDPTFHWAVRNPYARFCDTSEIMPEDEWLGHEFVRWNRPRLGSTHWLIGYTAPDDELTFGLSVHPPAEVGPLSADKKALFKMLFNHMERAIRLSARPPLLASAQECLVLLDRLGRIREMSSAARELLEEQDALTVWQGQLRALDSGSTVRLNQAILSALTALREGGWGGAVALPRRSGRRDLLVTVTPLVSPPSPFEAFRPAALVRIVDPELGAAPSAAERWAEIFGLSPAEARLAETLVGGDQNLRASADQLGVTYHTARVHLKHLLEKTRTHSQSQLARLLSRLE